ncbi:MAG: carboxymuconolactone decarboxylase family protein [Pigmentiphaga sp.]|uniref:carboxymuconolactone decarboxylase family protein n=1 Tax=Pigmentiphaga sp. TaxID=1977564 RepID=UPI0029ACA0B5|nr:carboxymuconolactone decarboxylase family protein [Pigmentiphaga sp.]MDX3904638.1 carboxymuconolactone decarboxylase family protein [Pigmentiphaga sp.]
MEERFKKGLAMRKQVLGEAPVSQRVEASRGALNADLQQLLTEFAWGDIWSRPQLGLRERSIATIAMLTALNRSTELKTHIEGALNNGLSMEEVAEVFLQAAVYCGFPAAMTSMRLAREVAAARSASA